MASFSLGRGTARVPVLPPVPVRRPRIKHRPTKTSKYIRLYGKTLYELARERGVSPFKVWWDLQKQEKK